MHQTTKAFSQLAGETGEVQGSERKVKEIVRSCRRANDVSVVPAYLTNVAHVILVLIKLSNQSLTKVEAIPWDDLYLDLDLDRQKQIVTQICTSITG